MTTRDVLKQSGLTDEQISALDQKILIGFDSVLTTANADREAAELAQRAQQQMYSDQIAPALDGWANESAQLKAELAFYKTQAEQARAGGFIAKDAPGYTSTNQPPRDPAGKFVPNANDVPGSPAYLTPADGIKAVSNVTWVMTEYQRLFGEPMPHDFETLVNESVAQRMNFRDYVDKKYGFSAKRAEITANKQKEHDDRIVKETEARIRKEYAEAGGNNPATRMGVTSQFTKVREATAAGQRKDPLTLNPEQRRAQTRQNIQAELTDNAAATVS